MTGPQFGIEQSRSETFAASRAKSKAGTLQNYLTYHVYLIPTQDLNISQLSQKYRKSAAPSS